MFKRHSFAVLALLVTTTSTTSPDCSLEGAKLPPVTNSATCSSLSPDIQASGGWRGVESPQVADGALFFTVQARPTVAGLNGLVAVAPKSPVTFPTLRFWFASTRMGWSTSAMARSTTVA